MSNQDPFDIVILTALEEEYSAICELIDNIEFVGGTADYPNLYAWRIGHIYSPLYDKEYSVVIGLTGHAGNTRSAVAAQNAIDRWNPRYLIFVGIAGGMRECKKGDVVIGNFIRGYEYGKIDKNFAPRSDWSYDSDIGLFTSAEAVSNEKDWYQYIKINPPEHCEPKVIIEEIASGDKIIEDPSNEFFQQVLHAWPRIVAIEMEGAGVGEAIRVAHAKGKGIGFIMIRGISDLPRNSLSQPNDKLETRGTAERDNWKRFASGTAAAFAYNFIVNYFPVAPRSLGESINIAELRQRTESILDPIHPKILFRGKEIKIDRSAILSRLRNAFYSVPLAILSGEGGTGKTALVKELYEELKDTTPFFVFKGSDFSETSLKELFGDMSLFPFADFLKEHESREEKYVVIDSAEQLFEIKAHEVFQDFLRRFFKSGWKVIFTIRSGYLDDLTRQLIELFNKHTFEMLTVENISKPELYHLGATFEFAVPQNERLLDLLLTPFYLNEYLQTYESGAELRTYSEFRKVVWKKKIQNSSYRKNNIHLRRERCFLEIAKRRADSGSFYVHIDNLNNEALVGLESDEIITHDPHNLGYFFNHDIYEEWAFDKIIEKEFNKTQNYRSFLQSFGRSLPILRAFRNWLSEKLLFDASKVKALVEESIDNDQIEGFWKDELLISILLCDYAVNFFQDFETKLLDDKKLLMRIVFLLRTACKQIDDDLLRRLGLQQSERIAFESVFTEPKGKGWALTIDFICRHKEEFGLRNVNTILPLLCDWNNKNTSGESTRKASLIGLYYYEQIWANGGFGYSSRETESQITRVILQGSQEIKNKLSQIFEEFIAGKTTSYRDKYYGVVKTVLGSLTDGIETIKALPECVIKLADLYWFQFPKDELGYSGIGVAQYFCIAETVDNQYSPASSNQTPIYQLLRHSPKATIDFIISFTNKTVECFAQSTFKKEVEEIELIFDDGEVAKQYICSRLWNTYRGTKVSAVLLASIHMALERYLLEQAKITSKEILESECECILRNSKSASLTAVVESVVRSQPAKLFNIAKILFRTKELFFYDSERLVLDQRQKNHLLMLKTSLPSLGDYQREIHEYERIGACDDDHRKLSLEHIAFQYQLVTSDDNPDFEKQRERIWAIWDEYYKELPPESEQTDGDKTWRLFLARMDIRKMIPKTRWEEKEGKMLVTFEPEIDSKLKKYSEDSLQKTSKLLKYMPLKLWSELRFEREEDEYKTYEQYERDSHLAITEAQEIRGLLAKGDDKQFILLNYSIPAYACAVLVRDFADVLTDEEKTFCVEVVDWFSSRPLEVERYSYDISDGAEPCILSLPLLMEHFPRDKGGIKKRLLFLLLNPWPQISSFATRAVLDDLWKISPEDAQSILLGYLVLQPKYRSLVQELQKAKFTKKVDETSTGGLQKTFQRRYGKELKKVASNSMTYDDLGDLKELGLGGLNTAFQLLPLETEDKVHKIFLAAIFPMFAEKVMSDEYRPQDDDHFDYKAKLQFLNKFACFVLSSKKEDIPGYLKPFVENFRDSRGTANFLQEFIRVEHAFGRYEEFWIVWDILYKPVVEICKKGHFRNQAAEIIHNYLLAWPWWPEGVKEWHSLRDREKSFLRKVAQEIGGYPPVFYSLCKILNDIGSRFLEHGIIWLSEIIKGMPKLASDELDKSTIYYLENLVQRYVVSNRMNIKTTRRIQDAIVVILNFLIDRESTTGYLLREHIP